MYIVKLISCLISKGGYLPSQGQVYYKKITLQTIIEVGEISHKSAWENAPSETILPQYIWARCSQAVAVLHCTEMQSWKTIQSLTQWVNILSDGAFLLLRVFTSKDWTKIKNAYRNVVCIKQMRRQMLVRNLYVFTLKFLAYKKD